MMKMMVMTTMMVMMVTTVMVMMTVMVVPMMTMMVLMRSVVATVTVQKQGQHLLHSPLQALHPSVHRAHGLL